MFDDSCYMAPLHLAGRLIMENGGETYRVEETITRMGHSFGLKEVESFAVPSGIFISYRKADGTIETAVKRVRKGAINLTRVNAVNAISREMEQQQIPCDEVLSRLQDIERSKPMFGRLGMTAAVAVSSGGWTVMFGGGAMDFLIAIVVCALANGLSYLLDRLGMRSLVSTLTGSFLATFLPMLFHLWTGLLADGAAAAVSGALMPMLPGLAMTNAVQDTMRGDMISGISSATSAVLTASLIAGGALIGTAFFRLITGGALL